MTSNQLFAYITARLSPHDRDHAEDIAADALARALQTGQPADRIACDLIRQRSVSYLNRLTPLHTGESAPVIGIPRPRTPRPQTAHLADVA